MPTPTSSTTVRVLAVGPWHGISLPVTIIVLLFTGSLDGDHGDRYGFGLILGPVLFSGPAIPVGHRGPEA